MEVVYNVKYRCNTREVKTDQEKKYIFNRKLLNVIIIMEKNNK